MGQGQKAELQLAASEVIQSRPELSLNVDGMNVDRTNVDRMNVDPVAAGVTGETATSHPTPPPIGRDTFVFDPILPAQIPPRRGHAWFLGLGLVATSSLIFASAHIRAVVAALLAIVMGAWLLSKWLNARPAMPKLRSSPTGEFTDRERELRRFRPSLHITTDTLWLVDGPDDRTALLDLKRPFGLTLFATPRRDRLAMALTHRDGVRFVAGCAPTGEVFAELLARAITTERNDLPLPEFTERSSERRSSLREFQSGDDLLGLADTLEKRFPGSLDRMILSDASMNDLVLDGDRLRIRGVDFDLTEPLTFRAFAFQEGSAFGAHAFHATHVRQEDREVILVCLAPAMDLYDREVSVAALSDGPLANVLVQHSVARDLRLSHHSLDVPPPRNLRVATDRLFMGRIRDALDRAPKESKASLSTSPDRTRVELSLNLPGSSPETSSVNSTETNCVSSPQETSQETIKTLRESRR